MPSQRVRSVLVMSTKAITPRLADRLCSLAESQLQTQVARSASVDAGALDALVPAWLRKFFRRPDTPAAR